MQVHHFQKGVGLTEVLVALLLLAIGILGFVALQLRAVDAASEATSRIQATNIARDLSEKMRINNSSIAFDNYKNSFSNGANLTNEMPDCSKQFCSPSEKAIFDVKKTNLDAQNLGMQINMIPCPGIENIRQCLYVAWGKTAPVHNSLRSSGDDGKEVCTQGNQVSYNPKGTCLVMETY